MACLVAARNARSWTVLFFNGLRRVAAACVKPPRRLYACFYAQCGLRCLSLLVSLHDASAVVAAASQTPLHWPSAVQNVVRASNASPSV